MATDYDAEERAALLAQLDEGRRARCPRCGCALERTEVPPRSDVGYVRRRVWLICSRCDRMVVLDSP